MKKYILIFLLFISLPTFANESFLESILDNYRENGLKSLEKKLDWALTYKSYWEKKVNKYITKYGWYENPQYILFCDTNRKRLDLVYVDNNKIKKLLSSSIAIGKNGYGKSKEGDYKTPIGVYKIIEKRYKIDTSIYGPFAYVLNYPNKLDKSFQRDGHGIWIHGFPIDCKDKKFTKGCVATPNNNLLQIDKKIDYGKSIVIISPYKNLVRSSKDIVNLLSFIYKWRYYWKYNDFKNYISLYSKDLKTVYGNYKKFANRKKRIFARNYKKEIRFTNIKITPYPNLGKESIWRVEMDEFYKAPNLTFKGKKILYIRKEKTGFKIWREY